MIRRSFRIGLRVGLVGGIAAAVVKAVQSRRGSGQATEEAPGWPPLDDAAVAPMAPAPELADGHPPPAAPEMPELQADDTTPAPVKKSAAKKASSSKSTTRPGKKAAATGEAWVQPTGAVCPPSHPIKAKLSSKLYHLPGMFAYARTTPDRCYRNEDDAVADGLRRAKR